jgi:hypothetical protein
MIYLKEDVSTAIKNGSQNRYRHLQWWLEAIFAS